jgi:hypothetical protein
MVARANGLSSEVYRRPHAPQIRRIKNRKERKEKEVHRPTPRDSTQSTPVICFFCQNQCTRSVPKDGHKSSCCTMVDLDQDTFLAGLQVTFGATLFLDLKFQYANIIGLGGALAVDTLAHPSLSACLLVHTQSSCGLLRVDHGVSCLRACAIPMTAAHREQRPGELPAGCNPRVGIPAGSVLCRAPPRLSLRSA